MGTLTCYFNDAPGSFLLNVLVQGTHAKDRCSERRLISTPGSSEDARAIRVRVYSLIPPEPGSQGKGHKSRKH